MARPKLFTLSIEDRKESIKNLIETSSPNAEFFLLLVLSTAIVVPGLLINNSSVIIGGMVVAPLLSPILALSLGVVLSDFKLLWRSARTILASMVAVIGFGFLMSIFTEATLNQEIISRADVSLAYLIIAIAAGAAAAFAWSKPNLSAALPGVAVSVALLPPLAVTGIGFSIGNWKIAAGSLLLFIVNLIGMQFAALVVYSLMGFYPLRHEAEEKLEEEEKARKVEERMKAERVKLAEDLERKERALSKKQEEIEKEKERVEKEGEKKAERKAEKASDE